MLPRILVGLSAAVILLLGSIHLLYTFRGDKLHPREAATKKAMQDDAPVLTRETSVWGAWIGFNASHSLGAILYGLIYGYLVLRHPGLLFTSAYLMAIGFLMLVSLFLLARRYWFSVPFRGITLSLLSYAAGIGLALTS